MNRHKSENEDGTGVCTNFSTLYSFLVRITSRRCMEADQRKLHYSKLCRHFGTQIAEHFFHEEYLETLILRLIYIGQKRFFLFFSFWSLLNVNIKLDSL